MTTLNMSGLSFEADLVAFDKDGTLIDLDFMWSRIVVAWAELLRQGVDDEALLSEFFKIIGYDVSSQRVLSQSPLAIASIDQLHTIAASVLYRHGIPWTKAEVLARSAYAHVGADLPLSRLVRPTGNVQGLLKRLKAAGAKVAVITADCRFETQETMDVLGVSDSVDLLVCGDDGLPTKPQPDMLLAACQQLNVAPRYVACVGDTVADLLMARRANVGCVVAVLSGAGEENALREHADVVLNSVDEIADR